MTKKRVGFRVGLTVLCCGAAGCALGGPHSFEQNSSEVFAEYAAASLQDPTVAQQLGVFFDGAGSGGGGGSLSRVASISQPGSEGWKQHIRGWLLQALMRLPEGKFDSVHDRTTHVFSTINSDIFAALGPVGQHLQRLQQRLETSGVLAFQWLPDKEGVELRIEDSEGLLYFLARSSAGGLRGQWRQEFGGDTPMALWERLDDIAVDLDAGPASMKLRIGGQEVTIQEWRKAVTWAEAAGKALWVRWSVPLGVGIELSMQNVKGEELYDWVREFQDLARAKQQEESSAQLGKSQQDLQSTKKKLQRTIKKLKQRRQNGFGLTYSSSGTSGTNVTNSSSLQQNSQSQKLVEAQQREQQLRQMLDLTMDEKKQFESDLDWKTQQLQTANQLVRLAQEEAKLLWNRVVSDEPNSLDSPRIRQFSPDRMNFQRLEMNSQRPKLVLSNVQSLSNMQSMGNKKTKLLWSPDMSNGHNSLHSPRIRQFSQNRMNSLRPNLVLSNVQSLDDEETKLLWNRGMNNEPNSLHSPRIRQFSPDRMNFQRPKLVLSNMQSLNDSVTLDTPRSKKSERQLGFGLLSPMARLEQNIANFSNQFENNIHRMKALSELDNSTLEMYSDEKFTSYLGELDRRMNKRMSTTVEDLPDIHRVNLNTEKNKIERQHLKLSNYPTDNTGNNMINSDEIIIDNDEFVIMNLQHKLSKNFPIYDEEMEEDMESSEDIVIVPRQIDIDEYIETDESTVIITHQINTEEDIEFDENTVIIPQQINTEDDMESDEDIVVIPRQINIDLRS